MSYFSVHHGHPELVSSEEASSSDIPNCSPQDQAQRHEFLMKTKSSALSENSCSDGVTSATATIIERDLKLQPSRLQQGNSSSGFSTPALDQFSSHGENKGKEFSLNKVAQEKPNAKSSLSSIEGWHKPSTSMATQSYGQLGIDKYRKGELLSQRLSINLDKSDSTFAAGSKSNITADLLPSVSLPLFSQAQDSPQLLSHRHQQFLLHQRQKEQAHQSQLVKLSSEEPIALDDGRTMHYNGPKSSSVILSDRGGVKTMIWKDNSLNVGEEFQSAEVESMPTPKQTTRTTTMHTRPTVSPSNLRSPRPGLVLTPPALPLTQQTAHFHNHTQQHQRIPQPPRPRLFAPPPQCHPLPTHVGLTYIGENNRQNQQESQQFSGHFFCHKSVEKGMSPNAAASSTTVSTMVYPPAPSPISSLASTSHRRLLKNQNNEERIDQLINADQAIRMSNAVDGLLSLRTVHAAAAAAAAAATVTSSVSSSSPSSSPITATNITKLLPARPSSTPNVFTPSPHLNSSSFSNHHALQSSGMRRSPINMERLWAGDRSQLPSQGQTTADVRSNIFQPFFNSSSPCTAVPNLRHIGQFIGHLHFNLDLEPTNELISKL